MINAIIFGGKSFEHEISVVSAITVSKKIPSIETFVFIDDTHTFYLVPKDKMMAKTFSSKAFTSFKKLSLVDRGFEYGRIFKTSLLDLSFINMVHGADGEDGKLAGLFDFYNIDFIGPRVAACSMSFDKYLTKMYAKEMGVNVLDYYVLGRGEKIDIPFEFPVIVKPLTLGSSIGIGIVKEESELDYALDTAFEYDDKVIIEPFIDGVKEYNIAGTLGTNGWTLSMIEEPAKTSFLDFDKKYLDFSRTTGAQEAKILDKIRFSMNESFKKIYGHYFKGAIIRCDFFVINDEVYLNEINPIPGSLANYLFEDFNAVVELAQSATPLQRDIKVQYNYIQKIHAAKGK